MGVPRNLLHASETRVFFAEGGAGPGNQFLYKGLGRAQAVADGQGALTAVRLPSDRQYRQFITVDRYRGQKPLPTLGVQFRDTHDLSDVWRTIRKGCEVDIQIHTGQCSDPTDFQSFTKIIVLERALSTGYTTSELGAWDANQELIVDETTPWEGLDAYEIGNILPGETAASEIVQECVDVAICDSVSCGACGLPSDGCQVVFILQRANAGSPGSPAKIIFTSDGGGTWDVTTITTLPANVDPTALACVGENLVVISNADNSIHYAPLADIVNGDETWTKVTTGLVAMHAPNAIYSSGRAFTWLVGDGGYVYFSSDITAGVTLVQSSGGQTTQDLKAIHAFDDLHLVAVGASNAVLVTSDGGAAWAAVTGPDVGVQLNTVWMRTAYEWIVGANDGTLWYTRDAGVHWSALPFPGTGAGKVTDIQFASNLVGYMAHTDATPKGYILRTIDGGATWYRLPGKANVGVVFPTNAGLNAIAACRDDVNVVFAAGVKTADGDGIAIKAA